MQIVALPQHIMYKDTIYPPKQRGAPAFYDIFLPHTTSFNFSLHK